MPTCPAHDTVPVDQSHPGEFWGRTKLHPIANTLLVRFSGSRSLASATGALLSHGPRERGLFVAGLTCMAPKRIFQGSRPAPRVRAAVRIHTLPDGAVPTSAVSPSPATLQHCRARISSPCRRRLRAAYDERQGKQRAAYREHLENRGLGHVPAHLKHPAPRMLSEWPAPSVTRAHKPISALGCRTRVNTV